MRALGEFIKDGIARLLMLVVVAGLFWLIWVFPGLGSSEVSGDYYDPADFEVKDEAPVAPVEGRLFGSDEDLLAPAADCLIKGNISFNTGEAIYHVPGQEYYDLTKINEAYGERWFCSEEEAQAAGWRRSEL